MRPALHAPLLLAALLLGTPAAADRWDRPLNIGSHGPEFIGPFRNGKVYVYRSLFDGLHGARLYGRTGAVFCFGPPGQPSRWKTGSFKTIAGHGTRFNKKAVQFYDPDTGRLHIEYHANGPPRIGNDGWIQSGWPRAMADACPGLELPADLPINERQTALNVREMLAQDPDAPIRDALGSRDRRTPGGTGIAEAGGGPTWSRGEFAAWINGHSGELVENLIPTADWLPHREFVLAPRGGADGDTTELWWLDVAGEIVDVTRLEPSADRSRVTFVSAAHEPRPIYHVGYAWPFIGIGERHPAFLLTDWLSSLDRPVSIPWWEQGEAGFQFLSWGQVAATSTEGEALTGSWWWSAGKLHLRLDDGSGDPPAVYPWRGLAKHVGWEIPEGWR